METYGQDIQNMIQTYLNFSKNQLEGGVLLVCLDSLTLGKLLSCVMGIDPITCDVPDMLMITCDELS